MLKLPVPEADYENVVLKPSEYQKDMVASLAERAEAVRDRKVDAAVDNMLKITMKVGNKVYTDKKEAGTALVEMCKEMKSVNTPTVIGEYAGFKMAVSFDSFNHKFVMNVKGQLSHNLEIGSDPLGNITRINNALESMTKQLEEAQTKLSTVEHQLETAKMEVTKPFAQEAELAEKLERLSALNALLNMDEKGDNALGMDDSPDMDNAGEEEKEGRDTSGHDVQKPDQEEPAIWKPDTAETAADTPKPYPVENARHNYAVDNGNPQSCPSPGIIREVRQRYKD